MSSLFTTISIKESTKKGLSLCKEHKRETWDDLMNRLVKMYKNWSINHE